MQIRGWTRNGWTVKTTRLNICKTSVLKFHIDILIDWANHEGDISKVCSKSIEASRHIVNFWLKAISYGESLPTLRLCISIAFQLGSNHTFSLRSRPNNISRLLNSSHAWVKYLDDAFIVTLKSVTLSQVCLLSRPFATKMLLQAYFPSNCLRISYWLRKYSSNLITVSANQQSFTFAQMLCSNCLSLTLPTPQNKSPYFVEIAKNKCLDIPHLCWLRFTWDFAF